MIFISALEIFYVVIPDPKIFQIIAASVADAAVSNTNGIKTLLTSGLSTFFIKGNPVLNNSPKSLPENPPDCPIFCGKLKHEL